MAMKFESPKFRGNVGFDLEPTDAGTRLVFRMRGEVKGMVSKLLMPLFMPMVRRQVRGNFDTLKGILESQQ